MMCLRKSRLAQRRVTREESTREGGRGRQGQDERPGGQALSASSTDSWGWIVPHCRGRWVRGQCIVGYLVASWASTHQMPFAPP